MTEVMSCYSATCMISFSASCKVVPCYKDSASGFAIQTFEYRCKSFMRDAISIQVSQITYLA